MLVEKSAANMLLAVFVFLLSSVLLAALPSSKEFQFPMLQSSDLIAAVCEKTKNPGFCAPFFTRDPRSRTAGDFTVLAQIAVDGTSQELTSVFHKVQTLSRQNKDPALKQSLDTCLFLYGSLANFDKEAGNYLKNKDYRGFLFEGSNIERTARNCERNLVSSNPSSPSPLAAENQSVEDYANILQIVASLLMK